MQEKTDGNNLNRVNELISYIEKNINKNDTTVNEHLFYIKSLLKQSLPLDGEKINIAKIYEAIHYIETMRIKVPHSIFSEKVVTMAELMSKKGEVLLPAYERKQKPINLKHQIGTVSASAENQFGSLHHALVELISLRYQFLKEEELRTKTKKPSIAWNYDYPLDESNEIMNQAIGEWQAKYIKKILMQRKLTGISKELRAFEASLQKPIKRQKIYWIICLREAIIPKDAKIL